MTSSHALTHERLRVRLIDPPRETTPTCLCKDDPTLDQLRDLIAGGMSQWDASLLLYATPEVPTFGSSATSRVTWARLEARRIANRARAALGLPEVDLTPAAVIR